MSLAYYLIPSRTTPGTHYAVTLLRGTQWTCTCRAARAYGHCCWHRRAARRLFLATGLQGGADMPWAFTLREALEAAGEKVPHVRWDCDRPAPVWPPEPAFDGGGALRGTTAG